MSTNDPHGTRSPELVLARGGDHYHLPSLRFAAAAVIAAPGYTIERAVLPAPTDLPDGYLRVEAHLRSVARPITALCGIELRMPASLQLEGFKSFNNRYLSQLDDWGLLVGGVPPLTRTNVCPRSGVSQPGLLAFSYTVERAGRDPSYVVSGIADIPGGGRYPDDIVRRGETTPDALREKAKAIIGEVAGHIAGLGVAWTPDATVHLYSLHDVTSVVATQLLPEFGVTPIGGVVVHDTAPPTAELELEIDVRAYDREMHLPS